MISLIWDEWRSRKGSYQRTYQHDSEEYNRPHTICQVQQRSATGSNELISHDGVYWNKLEAGHHGRITRCISHRSDDCCCEFLNSANSVLPGLTSEEARWFITWGSQRGQRERRFWRTFSDGHASMPPNRSEISKTPFRKRKNSRHCDFHEIIHPLFFMRFFVKPNDWMDSMFDRKKRNKIHSVLVITSCRILPQSSNSIIVIYESPPIW